MRIIFGWHGCISHIDCCYSLIRWFLRMIDHLCLGFISLIDFLSFLLFSLSLFDITWDEALQHLIYFLLVPFIWLFLEMFELRFNYYLSHIHTHTHTHTHTHLLLPWILFSCFHPKILCELIVLENFQGFLKFLTKK